MNLVPQYDDPIDLKLKSYRPDKVFLNVNKISKVDHSDLHLIRDTPLPQDEFGTKI